MIEKIILALRSKLRYFLQLVEVTEFDIRISFLGSSAMSAKCEVVKANLAFCILRARV